MVTRMSTQGAPEARWLLLIHQIPPAPAYLRVKIGRRLQKLGAVAVKNSVYALPNTDEAQEHFAWVAREIASSGGDSNICESNFVGDRSNQGVEGLFNEARAQDFAALAEEARDLRKTVAGKRKLADATHAGATGSLGRLRRRQREVAQIDFFGAPGHQTVEALLTAVEARLAETPAPPVNAKDQAIPLMRGRTWVTRKNVHVDRIASAWLIRRFIDRQARFRFVSAKGFVPKGGELRFDMFEAEYTHEGDRCTFEVLLDRFRLATPDLRGIAEIVHAIDIRDGKFAPPEAAGVERIINGLSMTLPDDDERLAVGGAIFDGLCEALKKPKVRRP